MESLATTITQKQPVMSSSEFANLLVEWAADKKAEDIQLYHMTDGCSYADYVLICSGTSDRHVMTIAEHIRERAKKSKQMPLGTEGMQKGQWVLIDFSDVVVHVFYEPVREYYALERMWDQEMRVELPAEINA